MTDDKIKRYEEIKKHAASQCDVWFIANPEYFYDKAKLIAERREAWEKEASRLNPKASLTYFDEESGIWFPGENRCFPKKIEPSLVDPIFACVGKPERKYNEKITKVLIPSNKDDALLIYAAALLILHDGEAAIRGTGIITENIWPKEWWSWAIQFFDPHVITDDRSDFIEAAIRHVEADLAEKEEAERESQQGKIGFLSELTPEEPSE